MWQLVPNGGMLETTLYLQSMTLVFLIEQLLSGLYLFWQSFEINIQQWDTSQPLVWNIQLRLQFDLADPSCTSLQLHLSGISNVFMSIDPQIKSFQTGAGMAFPWDGYMVKYQVQPSQRTSADYFIILDGCCSSLQEVTARVPEK